jgi:hypothetical protein
MSVELLVLILDSGCFEKLVWTDGRSAENQFDRYESEILVRK